ncbi:MAG: diacylglycerol/polyprenol kinase family protein, partial [bacterium]
FVAINFASYKLKFFQAIEEESGDNLGTILFPASFAILLAIFWNLPDRTPAMMGLMALAWGDAFAAIIGRRYGKLRYRVLGEQRSLEGSFAMYVFSFLACSVVLAVEHPGLSVMTRVAIATTTAVGCTLLEACAIRGLDNLLIPLGGAGIAWWLLNRMG